MTLVELVLWLVNNNWRAGCLWLVDDSWRVDCLWLVNDRWRAVYGLLVTDGKPLLWLVNGS